MLDRKDRLLLSHVQDSFPLDPRPYAVIARRLGLSPAVVLRKVRMFRKKGIIRYIGAVLDTKRLGFKSSLGALAVPPSRIRPVSTIINRYPEVTHNYVRDDEYNMWFTVSARTDARLAALIRRIRRDAGISKCLDLPTVKVYKIDARFALVDGSGQARRALEPGSPVPSPGRARLTPRILAALAQKLDESERPFRQIGRKLKVSEKTVTELMAAGIRRKLIRRFGAVLDHYKIGLTTNALVAWQVKDRDIAQVAGVLCGVANISHCYQRQSRPGWPYTLYTMVHAVDRRHAAATLTLIFRSIGHKIKGTKILFTVRELKKTRFTAGRAVRIDDRRTQKV